jgi:hypothetical protein
VSWISSTATGWSEGVSKCSPRYSIS